MFSAKLESWIHRQWSHRGLVPCLLRPLSLIYNAVHAGRMRSAAPRRLPVPVVVADYLLGEKILTGGRLLQREPQNPAAECYRIFCGGARSSWDPIVAFYAVYGESGCLRLSSAGRIHIGAGGVSVFEEKEGGGHRLLRCADAASLREKIDAAMCGQVDKK